MCRICPSGHVSAPISASCHACEGLLVRNVPDEMQQSCILDNMELLFAALLWIAGTIFCHLLLTGLFGQLPLADVSKQGQKVLITSSIPHFVLTWQCPEVFFTATGALHLEQPPTTQWKVESHSFDQLTLHGDIEMPLDTSMGHLHFKFPRAFIATGLWHVPLIFWCLASASGAAAARQLHWKVALLVAGLSMCAGLLSFFLRRRRSQRTPLVKRRRQFLKEWPLALENCSRGPDRSMSAGLIIYPARCSILCQSHYTRDKSSSKILP